MNSHTARTCSLGLCNQDSLSPNCHSLLEFIMPSRLRFQNSPTTQKVLLKNIISESKPGHQSIISGNDLILLSHLFLRIFVFSKLAKI